MPRDTDRVRHGGPPSTGTNASSALTGSVGYAENGAGRREARDLEGEFAIDFDTADRVSVGDAAAYEFVPRPFRIARGRHGAGGRYDYGGMTIAFQAGQQRTFNGRLALEHGSFSTGTRRRRR